MKVLFALAFLIRLAYLLQIRGHPLFELPVIDALSYHQWARAILAGDWLGKGVFYQDPSYPYFLAIFYGIFGEGRMALALFQALLDSAAAVLLMRLGTAAFSRPVGIIAGTAAALYGASVFYTGLFEKTTFSLFITVAFLYGLSRSAAGKTGPAGFLGLGTLLGAAILMRGNFLLLAPLFAGWLAWTRRLRPRKEIILSVGVFTAGALLVVLPVTLRNAVVGGDWVLTTSQGGWNFYVGNSAKSSGRLAPAEGVANVPEFEQRENTLLAQKALGRPLKPSAVSRYWFRKGLAFIRDNPAAYLRLQARKIFYLANRFEFPDTYDYYYFRRASSVLRATPLGWGIVFPLGVSGLGLWLYRRKFEAAPVLLAVYFVGYSLSLLLFYIAGRYRLPLAPVLILFAAYAVVEIGEMLRRGRRTALAGILIPVLLLGAFSHASVEKYDDAYADFTAGNALLLNSRPREAIVYYEKIIPANKGRLDFNSFYARALLEAGRSDESITIYRRVIQIDPSFVEAYRNLARLYAAKGEKNYAELFSAAGKLYTGEAPSGRRELEALLGRAPAKMQVEIYDLLAFASYRRGDFPEAVEAWRRSLQVKPRQPGVLMNLFLLSKDADPAAARDYLRRYIAYAEEDSSLNLPLARKHLSEL